MPLIIAAAIWAWGHFKMGEDWYSPGVYVFFAFLLSLVYKGMIGAEAGRRILEDRKIGSWELLLSTPLSVREIFRGQYFAIVRQFAGPVAVMLIADVVLLIAGLRAVGMDSMERRYWLWTGLGGIVMFGADCVALYWMGMWYGLASKNPRNAFGAAIAPVLTLPWVATGIVMTVVGLMPFELRRSFYFGALPLCLWFSFSMLADLCFSFYARYRLTSEFRTLAAQRFQPKPSLWQRLTGRTPAAPAG
jgi:hypothetical protein